MRRLSKYLPIRPSTQGTPHDNIGRILLYEYDKLRRHLKLDPSKRDVDRYCILNSEFYALVFGSWSTLETLAHSDDNTET